MPDPGHVFAIGGHEDRTGDREILRAIAATLDGWPLAVAATASRVPGRYVALYSVAFGELGVEVHELSMPDRGAATAPAALHLLDRVGGVFFTGGNQGRLLDRVRGTTLHDRVLRLWQDGGTLAGTSAGASALGERAIKPRGTEEGLGVIPDSIVDQHFAQRDRFGRLAAAVAADGSRTGYGIDEDTALVLHAGRAEVIGSGSVTVIAPSGDVTRRTRGEHVTGAARP